MVLIEEEGRKEGKTKKNEQVKKVKILWYIIFWGEPGLSYLNINNFVSVSREKGVWGELTFSKFVFNVTSGPLCLDGIENYAGFGLN